jgi:hypothetical protein
MQVIDCLKNLRTLIGHDVDSTRAIWGKLDIVPMDLKTEMRGDQADRH